MERPRLTRRALVHAGLGAAAATSAGRALAQAGPPVGTPPAVTGPPPNPPGALTTGPTVQTGLSPRLTMHAIDTFHGTPGAGMVCDLAFREGDTYKPIKTITTAANGRSPEPLLVDEALKPGRYELLMHFEEYFEKAAVKLPSPNFLSLVPVRFVIRDVGQRYHLPILFSPWGYSYYRGS